MITKIATANVKGLSIALELAPLSVITGENFAGKSTIAQAIVIALNGYLPALGKQHKQTFRASSGSSMTVQAALSDGTEAVRNWKQSGKTIKYTGPKGPVESGVSILSGEAFTAAKPADRLAMLANHAGAALAELDKVISSIEGRHSLTGLPKPEADETTLDRAKLLLDQIDEELSARRARKVQFEKTLQGLSELAATDTTEEPEDLTARLQEARDKVRDTQRALEAAETAVMDGHDARAEVEAYLDEFPEANVEPEEPAGVNLPDLQSKLREATGKAALARQAYKAAVEKSEIVPFGPDQEATLAELEKLNETDWQGILAAARDVVAESKTKAMQADTAKRAAHDKIDKLIGMECCPTCKAAGTDWKAAVLAELREALNTAQTERDTQEKRQEGGEKDRDHATQMLQFLQQLPQLRKWKADSEAATTAAESLHELSEEVRLWESSEKAFTEKVTAAGETATEYRKALARHEKWKAIAGKVKEAAELTIAADKASSAFETAVDEHSALKHQHETAEPARLAWTAKLSRKQDIEKARKSTEEEEEKITALDTSKTELKLAVDAELKKLYEPIVKVAVQFSEGLLPSPLALDPTNAQIGRWEGTTFIPFEIMSGAEQLVAIASLQVGLASAGSGIVILDEVSRMRPDVKRVFAGRLAGAVERGGIEQAILIDHTADVYGKEWQIITMGE